MKEHVQFSNSNENGFRNSSQEIFSLLSGFCRKACECSLGCPIFGRSLEKAVNDSEKLPTEESP